MNYCQSCGMPMEDAAMHGTLANGEKTSEFCTYCYQKGAYTQPDMTMDQMINVCVPHMVEAGMEEIQAKQMLTQTLPMLKRWK